MYAATADAKAYTLMMVKRTSINLDFDLVDAASEVLQTSGTTQTVHHALREVVRQAKLRRLAARRFAVSEDELAELRRSRAAGEATVAVKKSRRGAR